MRHIKHIVYVAGALFTLTNMAIAGNYNDRFISETAPVIAFTNARMIDGTGAAARENHTVIIREGRITKIGRDGSVKIPKDAKRISLKGKSLTPGWVMTHEHLFYGTHPGNMPSEVVWNFLGTQQTISYPRLYLSAGVTSARTAGAIYYAADLGVKRAIDAGHLVGPDFDLTAPFLSGELGEMEQLILDIIKTPEEAHENVRFWAGRGFTSIKLSGGLRDAPREAAIDETHSLGLRAISEFGHTIAQARKSVEFGARHLEHVIPYRDEKNWLAASDVKIQSVMQYLIDKNVTVSMTMAEWDHERKPDSVLDLLTDYSRKEYERAPFGIWANVIADGAYLRKQQELALAFWRKGGVMSLGTDPAVQGNVAGYANLRSIELMAAAGIPNIEVIKMATLNGAKVIGIEDDRGTLEVGKRADLIVMAGDPSKDIKAIYNIETVFKNGVGYDPAALIESVKGTVGGPG